MPASPPLMTVDTPTLLRPFHHALGPIALGLVVFVLSQLSQFNPQVLRPDLMLWYCGPFIAQVLLFIPSQRHWKFYMAAFGALVASNALMMSSISAVLWISALQTLEPIVGLMIICYVLRCQSGPQVRVNTSPRRIVIGTLASSLWIHTLVAIGIGGLQLIKPLDFFAQFTHWAGVATISAATSLPIFLGLSFWRTSKPSPTWAGPVAMIVMLPTTLALFAWVDPAFVMLALMYPIMLGLAGVGYAGLLFFAGIMGWVGLIQMEVLDSLYMTAAPLLMMVATVCLVTGILHIQKTYSTTRLRDSAQSDPLTGLLNRRGLRDHWRDNVEQFLVLIDIDYFKQINDSQGYAAGDQLLARIAKALKAFSREGDGCSRVGGDEFVIVGAIEGRDIDAWTTMLQRQLQNLRPQSISASIGWTRTVPGTPLDLALIQADQALFWSKRAGRAQTHQFDPNRRMDPRDIPATVIRNALAAGELYYAIQPIYDTQLRRRIGNEALIRWRRNGVELRPDQFLLALLKISRELEVQAQLLQLQTDLALKLGPGSGVLSFNWTLEDLADKQLVDRWLANWEPIAGRIPNLVIEITESGGFLDDQTPAMLRTMQRLRAAGYQIALDDFGKEHSNLSRLVGWPVDRLKLDKSLIDGLEIRGSGADVIIRTIKTLCDQLECGLIAEGVETLEQSLRLNQLGVRIHQGYLWGRPRALDT